MDIVAVQLEGGGALRHEHLILALCPFILFTLIFLVSCSFILFTAFSCLLPLRYHIFISGFWLGIFSFQIKVSHLSSFLLSVLLKCGRIKRKARSGWNVIYGNAILGPCLWYGNPQSLWSGHWPKAFVLARKAHYTPRVRPRIKTSGPKGPDFAESKASKGSVRTKSAMHGKL